MVPPPCPPASRDEPPRPPRPRPARPGGPAGRGQHPAPGRQRLGQGPNPGHPHARPASRSASRSAAGSPPRWPAPRPGASATILARSGFFVPPMRVTARSAGWVHQSWRRPGGAAAGRHRLGQRRDERHHATDRPGHHHRAAHVVARLAGLPVPGLPRSGMTDPPGPSLALILNGASRNLQHHLCDLARVLWLRASRLPSGQRRQREPGLTRRGCSHMTDALPETVRATLDDPFAQLSGSLAGTRRLQFEVVGSSAADPAHAAAGADRARARRVQLAPGQDVMLLVAADGTGRSGGATRSGAGPGRAAAHPVRGPARRRPRRALDPGGPARRHGSRASARAARSPPRPTRTGTCSWATSRRCPRSSP